MSEEARPGVIHGAYPERLEPRPSWSERLAERLRDRARGARPSARKLEAQAQAVIRRAETLADASSQALDERLAAVRPALRKRMGGEALEETLALIREQSRRQLGMAHFEVQLMAGIGLLGGLLVELDTGEGKTLSATLPAAAAALAGVPVHVITVNDYLVERDAELMAPLYEALGLRVGTVLDRQPDADDRRRAYACDITYVTNKQVAFDYLRDRLSRPHRRDRLRGEVQRLEQASRGGEGLLMRGLCYGIVDEADSVLVDEARTPLILSRGVPAPGLEEVVRRAMAIAGELVEPEHYRVSEDGKQATLSDVGRDEIARISAADGGIWNAPLRRAELVRVALTARNGYRRDLDYIVRDDSVEIVDASTGRSMPDRSWEGGLQQMIEVKEECEVSGERETIARISYQQFFRRYLRLGGMTGTAREVAHEIEDVYGLPMVRVEPRRPSRRIDLGVTVHADLESKWKAIVARLRELHEVGRPVLVGTHSVLASESLGEVLDGAGLPHVILNARQDAQEAEVIGHAGVAGRITVATNMAGRGSDLRVSPEVEALGGLHVLSVERAEARRIDRQLFGRCGRQGDAGSFEQILCLEDPLLVASGPQVWRVALRAALASALPGAQLVARLWADLAQRRVEARHADQRAQLLRSEDALERALAFAGASE